GRDRIDAAEVVEEPGVDAIGLQRGLNRRNVERRRACRGLSASHLSSIACSIIGGRPFASALWPPTGGVCESSMILTRRVRSAAVCLIVLAAAATALFAQTPTPAGAQQPTFKTT